LLLNNDVEIEPGFIQPLVEHFSDPRVFAVTGKIYELDTRIFCNGGKVGRFRHGFWSMYANYDVRGAEAAELLEARQLLSVTAIGGFSMFDRIKLMQLGGFDELMSPYHWEDIDLSYRGWKRGWEVHYEPRAVGYHNASSTINAHYRKKVVELVAVRNRLIFHWKNVHSRGMWTSHLLMLGLLLLISLVRLDFLFYRAFWQALGRLGEIRRKRREERRSSKTTDKALRQRLAQFYCRSGLAIVRSRKEALQLCEK
jgi:GT2 family glycosyltransferase